MGAEDLDDDERFVLALSLGILGAILIGAFLMVTLDSCIFHYDRYEDEDDDGEIQYLGDQMMQTSTSNLCSPPQNQSIATSAPQSTTSAKEQAVPPSSDEEAPNERTPIKPVNVNILKVKADQEIQEATQNQSKLQMEAQEEIDRVDIDRVEIQPSPTATTQPSTVQASHTSVEVIPIPPMLEEDSVDSSLGDSDSHDDDDYDKMDAMDDTKKSHVSIKRVVTGTVVPRMERVPPLRFLWLSILISIPTGGYIMYFTAMGFGEETFYYMTENYGDYASLVGGVTALFFVVLYLLDANFWTTKWLKQVCLAILVIGTVLTVLLLTGDYPYGPICCFAAITPLWLICCNQMWCCPGRTRTRDYVSSLSGPLFFISILTLAGFLGWTFSSPHHQYNRVTKVAFSQATGCEPNLEEYPHCAVDYTPSPSPSVVSPTTSPVLTFAPTTLGESNNSTARFLHVIPIGAEHEPHDHEGGNNVSAPALAGELAQNVSAHYHEIKELDEKNDKNVYTSEETGVCFDTVVSPPAFYLNDGCDPDCPEDLYNDCLNAFILWAGPLLCTMVLFFLSFFCTFLKGEDAQQDIVNFGKLWLFLLFSMWLTASLAGVAAGLSSALVAMTLASFVGSIVFVATTRSKAESKEQGKNLWARIEENYGAYMDWARGLFLVVCTPFIFLYLIFSFFNQFVRRFGLPCSKPIKTPQQRADFVTKRTRKQINSFQSWDRSKVLTYAIYWGIAFMILQVIVAQFTVLFLSWLIEVTSVMSLVAVTVILVGVGMIMFLLPPVPGVPIYLTLGIVILAVGQDTLGILGSMAYAAAVSLLLKLLACTVQQKLIGESLAKYTSVRKLVGINSTLIKAMRLVLAQPGMGLDKVCILVGGPDWPTSVLCGIMGLDLLPILFGTLPVFLLILPTMLTGSFMYMAGLKNVEGELLYPSASVLGTVFAAITALVQFAAMIMAAYYLEQTTSNRADELAAIPIDKEVAELEEAEVEFNNSYVRVTQWPVVPTGARLILYVAFYLIVASCYMVQFFSEYCFAPYALTYTIEKNLDGKWYNLVLPVGWVAILLFILSSVLLGLFITWASSRAKKELEAMPSNPEQPAESTSTAAGALPPSVVTEGANPEQPAASTSTAAGALPPSVVTEGAIVAVAP